jgi:hypothetical protein
MSVIPITTGSAESDGMPYVAMWPDGFIHGSDAMRFGTRVSVAVPVSSVHRLGERWGPTDETLMRRIQRGLARVDAIAEGDFGAVRNDTAPYATGRSHRTPENEADDAQHFSELYVAKADWQQLRMRMCEEGILPAGACAEESQLRFV